MIRTWHPPNSVPSEFVIDPDDTIYPCGSRRQAEIDHKRQTERRERLRRFIAS